ncbi:hypothetical protein FLAG1_08894 [Fusarium langsethiae]|uniref:Uncharacterized protein n=1 Tax=Fusarium langsethiae TaxID=179993 RepID=A0A0N0V5V4_FUSLA|nr:hypothetical protein FLAG1_08894 [Fusarium langsethiae]GKU20658.1 unnamed protein product [Fusarium langsethiae]
MSDNIDREKMVQAACLADLGRHRQEELPLSNQPRRGPTYAPLGKNGTGHYNPDRKRELSSKWGAKIDDEESRQMEGLEIEDARPWARDRAAEALSSNRIQSGPPPQIPTRKSKASSQPHGNGITVQFKPPSDAWKKCVGNMVKNSPVHSVIATKWGPTQDNSTPSATRQGAVSKPIEGHASNNHRSNGTSGNEAPVPIASPSTPLANGTQRVSLSFNLHQKGFDSNAAETVIGSGYCQIVPSKNEALSFTSSVMMKILEGNGGFLVFHSELKGDKALDVLDIDKPSIDGPYCKLQAKSQKWPYHVRFDNDEHVKLFKACLYRVKKAVLFHKKTEIEKDSQVADTEVTVSSPEPSTVTTNSTDTPTVSTIVPRDIAQTETDGGEATASTNEELIPMDDDWDSTNNPQVPAIQAAVNPMVALVRRCLEYFSIEGNFCAGTIAGIEDAIFDQWKSEGFLEDCGEREREAAFAMLRTFVDVELILSGKKPPGKTSEFTTSQQSCPQHQDAVPEQANGSNKRPRRGVTQGLGSSCFAKKPFACEGVFTGPRSRTAYK